MPRTHHLPDEQVHFTWDAGNAPVLEIDSGDTVVVWTRDVSDNQIGPDSDVSAIDGLDWDRVYPLAGPIAVHGAQPGDTLAIEILDIHTQGWGWTAVLPGLGLLPEDFPDAYCASSTSRTATLPSCARTSRSPSSRSSARWASAPPGRAHSP
jgi:acetamidase/formamidase